MTETTYLMNLIICFLTPMLLNATGGDRAQAEKTAIQTVNAYAASNLAELLLVGQSIALGIAMLSSVSLSMTENIPISLILRLRANAISLHRAAEQCRLALLQPHPNYAAPAPKAQARSAQPKPTPKPNPETPPATMEAAMAALAADSECRIAQADAAMKATGAAIPPKASAPMTEDDHFRAAWSAAMTDVAQEMQAATKNLPPDERRLNAQRIVALNATVQHLANPQQPSKI
jgi:hypothetical protein